MNVGVATGITEMVVGLATSNENNVNTGSIVSGFNKVINTFLTNYQHSLVPNSSIGNVNNGDINTASKTNTFIFMQRSIKKEFAIKLDNFFSAYGYKVNEVKLPNITGRLNWNFVKMIEPNIEGTEIPEIDLNKYKNQLEEGITFWHNYNTFRDYSQNNYIL